MSEPRPTGAPAAGSRVPELDGIRGLAILLVLVWHYVAINIPAAPPGSMLGLLKTSLFLTWSGVDLFFVLSGFLIGGILIDNRGATNFFRVFYVRRFCRILPLYFAWLGLFLLLRALSPRTAGEGEPYWWLFVTRHSIASYATFTQNFFMAALGDFGCNWLGITWSLAIEEQFYAVLPLLVWVAAPRLLPVVLGSVAVLAPMARWFIYTPPPGKGAFAVYVHSYCRADALMLGALCAWAVRDERIRAALARRLNVLYALLAALAAIIVWMGKNHTIFDAWMSRYGYSVMAVFYACLLLVAVLGQGGPIAAVFRFGPLRGLGIVAYGVYLFHQGCLGLLHGVLLHAKPRLGTAAQVGVTALAIFVTIALARLSWRWFERPIMALGHRLAYMRRTSEEAVAPGRSLAGNA